MNKSPIFAIDIIVKDSLYSMKYNDKEEELKRLFNDWTDVEFLNSFFENNKNDLFSGFYGDISLDEAVYRTVEEAKVLIPKVVKAAVASLNGGCQTLEAIFKPLDNNDRYIVKLQNSKAYGHERKSWLRLYAIKIEPNVFLITGGAIKLTETMSKSHLISELKKIEKIRNYLVDEDIFDNDSLLEVLKCEI